MKTHSYRRGTFELFPRLPLELRRKIWKETIRTTRRLLPSKPIPELAVCREARSVLLEIYQPCFKPLPTEEALLQYPTSLYANFELDIVLLDLELAGGEFWEHELWDFWVPEAILKIKHIAIKDTDWSDLGSVDRMNRQEGLPDARLTLFQLSGLKTLKLILTYPDPLFEQDPDLEPIDRDCAILATIDTGFMEDDHVYVDTLKFLNNMERMMPEWEFPELQLVRVVY
jgi:hypothetical protein